MSSRRGRRSPRQLPEALKDGAIVAAPATGDCLYYLVSKALDIGVADLRERVANGYDKESFELMAAAGQLPPTGSSSLKSFREGIIKDKAYADEKAMSILAKEYSLAFLILDDNLMGAPTSFPRVKDWPDFFLDGGRPKNVITLRLGREHYTGIAFQGHLASSLDALSPACRDFWSISRTKPGGAGLHVDLKAQIMKIREF